jgi:hypothetical protein
MLHHSRLLAYVCIAGLLLAASGSRAFAAVAKVPSCSVWVVLNLNMSRYETWGTLFTAAEVLQIAPPGGTAGILTEFPFGFINGAPVTQQQALTAANANAQMWARNVPCTFITLL